MATWTWMRYSYCWEIRPRTFVRAISEPDERYPLRDRYICLRATVVDTAENHGPITSRYVRLLADIDDPNLQWAWYSDEPIALGTTKHRCRIRHTRHGHSEVDAPAGRFTSASIAGLVVGAMGCFIFGLYLRGWLRERKALARQPGQDMIA
jgi:hypothetical protein